MIKTVKFEQYLKNYGAKMLVIAVIDAILAGFNLALFPFDYTINIAVVILPIYYYLDNKLNPIVTATVITSFGLLFRTVTGFYFYGNFKAAFLSDFPFLYFDLTYGIVFFLIFYRADEKSVYRLFIAAFAGDFIGNGVEFISRFGYQAYLGSNIMATLLAVALIRAFLCSVASSMIMYYKSFLKREEHDKRYRKQIQLMANLSGEIYFLKNNMENVEQVMDDAFLLYREYDTLTDPARKMKALDIAKNVHEIKKHYFNAVTGISNAVSLHEEGDLMRLSDFIRFIVHFGETLADSYGKTIEFNSTIERDYALNDHNLLMSVMTNLMTNGIEAIDEKGRIELRCTVDGSACVFKVSDSGEGIGPDEAPYIFNPGYSTKYNAGTGQVNRGVGLALVNDLVTQHFHGEITFETTPYEGTVFSVRIPLKQLM